MTRPLVGTRSPTRQLKKVDLPAPFGPISPTISPSPTARSAFDSAMKLPKARDTACASSSMDRPFLADHPDADAAPQLDQPAGLAAREDNDDATLDNAP